MEKHWSPFLGATNTVALQGEKCFPYPVSIYAATKVRLASEFGGSSIVCWKRGDPATQVRRAHVSGIHDFGPCRLAISPSGEIFVADLRNQRILRFENGSGPLVVDNTDAKPMFCSPNGVLYVVSQRGEEVQKLVGSRLEAPDSDCL